MTLMFRSLSNSPLGHARQRLLGSKAATPFSTGDDGAERRMTFAASRHGGNMTLDSKQCKVLRLAGGFGMASWLLVAATGCGLNAQAQNASGVRLYQQGFYPGAQQRFQQAIQNDPTNADG